jgi:hypothetical protein
VCLDTSYILGRLDDFAGELASLHALTFSIRCLAAAARRLYRSHSTPLSKKQRELMKQVGGPIQLLKSSLDTEFSNAEVDAADFMCKECVAALPGKIRAAGVESPLSQSSGANMPASIDKPMISVVPEVGVEPTGF